ncbi:UDP-N-acetylmuramoyl-L-alanyl-D-glutamate--L-lysine ligase [Paenibacillus konkukensis]|uniref:UDP-N-acetylmuramoyl-L-alanyl-D-glutamate--2,6-diaminopimelate ligase n=1 Tax=Paenibacillus konkukensis TaxID=2020716 RepID=A0ABY4RZ08_9BACL|nr:UDP-N-acetylmuramoyl-L-alanyl-D-glutamate--2,6-diaminopimelate ligase [Paenibacillus konkukensis]UQZ86609.1 UDP-N-acetylmuramoyl-L-alanyl-D-glutamate--L-lysine ligase [Paenibacillus konkukensis]
MELRRLLSGLHTIRRTGDDTVDITGVQMDFRRVRPGDLFVCIPGSPGILEDRHAYAGDAVRRGAAALVVERDVAESGDVPLIYVKDARYALAAAASRFYDYPSTRLKVIGITGTNGKTTTSHLIEHLLKEHGFHTGLMGNLYTRIGQEETFFANNTQEPPDLQNNLRRMADARADYCVMEVTSQGLDLGRVIGTRFHTAVFTNLTQDHLDYHLTMDNYLEAKGLLFSRLGNACSSDGAGAVAVLNADDSASDYCRRQTTAQIVTYGINNKADVTAANIRLSASGTQFDVSYLGQSAAVRLPLVGLFNVYNALAAIAAVIPEGIEIAEAARYMAGMKPVRGRMETIDEGQPFTVLIDYAHTPDGLAQALRAARGFTRGQLVAVFGCGGDRDRAKRPEMGRIAARLCGRIIVTSDNPRYEHPDAIMQDIGRGIVEEGFPASHCEMIADRADAIRRAVMLAGEGDVVIVAGKGHEDYQFMNGRRMHFDDREAVIDALREREGR